MSFIFCLVSKLSQYSCNVKGHMLKKSHGNLKCLKMCHSTPSVAEPEGEATRAPTP